MQKRGIVGGGVRIGAVVGLILASFGCGGSSSSGSGANPPPAPMASLSPASLTFSSETIGSTSPAQTVTLANTGNASLSVASISATGDFAQTNSCAASLAAGASCAIQVSFTPTSTGTRTGSLTVTDDASGSPQSVALSGAGTPAAGNAAAFYVATNGNDAWTGTLPAPNANMTDGPFATFNRARAAVQSVNKSGLSQVTVQFRAGTYFLPATEEFTAADSGTANTEMFYENYSGEAPVISGGVRVRNWANVGGNAWQATLPSSTRYFEQLFYNGVRRLRPRLGGYLGTYLRFAGPVYLNAPGPPSPAPDPNCSVYVSGSGWECFDRFQYNPADPISGAWRNLAPPPGNPCGQPAGNPNLAGDIELVDFEFFTAPKLRIDCIDTASHIVYLTGATAIDPFHPRNHGFLANHRYIVENVQDELTQPGQWFLDRSATPWTLTYLANSGEDPNTDTVIVPQLTQVLVASGLQYVTFRGLTFEHDDFTVPAAGHPSLQQEATISTAVSFQNSQHLVFDSDIVAETSGGGMEIISCIGSLSPAWCVSSGASAATDGNVIENSAFYDLGAMGIRVGVPNQPTDTDANVPQFTTVENDVIEGYGRVFPASFGISQGDGHDNTYTHNDVYDGYHAAISVCSPPCPPGKSNSNGAFDNVISFNHVYNLLQGIMDDGGALYFATGNSSFAATGNKMLNNKVHDVSDASTLDADGYGGNGLYLDNQTGMVDVENNLVYRVSGATMFITQAPPAANEAHTIKNNIFAYGRLGLIEEGNPYPSGSVPPNPILAFNASNNIFYFDGNSASAPAFYVQRGCTYSGGFPYTEYQNWTSNLYWRTDGAFASYAQAFHVQPAAGTISPCAGNPSTWTFYTFAGWQQNVGEDLQGVVQNPGFANPAYPADDYSLPAGSPGVGFVAFDPAQAGRTNPAIEPPVVPATFPTKSFDPASDF